MAYTIYDKNGNERLAVIEDSLQPNAGRFVEPQLEYSGTWMGECFITVNIKSPVPIDFAIGDYVMYRGEKFVINYDPSVIKKATKKSTGDAFCYDNVKFSALSYELSDIRMLDYVEGDNNLHYVGLPVFSFFCNDIDDFADRLQVNTDRYCEKNGITDGYKWIFVTPSSSRSASRAGGASGRAEEAYADTFGKYGPWIDDEKNNQDIRIDKMSVWDAMKYIKDSFGLNFAIRGRVVIIGASGMPTKDVFSYGKGNGLYEIERVADSEQQIVTKLYAYGSDKNMPERYYANVENSDLPNNLAVGFLMMPGFPTQSLYQWVKAHQPTSYNDSTGYATWHGYSAYFSKESHLPYIMSGNAYEYGVREATKYFDGSDGTDDIYPTIENSGIDTVYDAQVIEDSGVFADGATIPDFTITLPNLGFDLGSLITSESAIAMKDGPCGGREFPIVSAEQDENNRWVVTCNRTKDDSLGLYFPYSYAASTGGTPSANEVYQIRPGSKYVLIGIEMPSTYVDMASERLLENALAFLSKNDTPRYTYIPKVDEIFMARQAQEVEESEGDAYHDILKEGDVMVFEDNDLLISDAVCIDTLRIKEYGNNQIPTYEVTLRNDKQVGTIQRIQEQIGKITSGETSVGGGGGSSVNVGVVRGLIETYGANYFLRRNTDESTAAWLRFLANGGVRFGDTNQWYINHNGEAVLNSLNVDNLNALNAHFAQLIIDEIKSVGGMVIISPSSAKIFKVERTGPPSMPLYRMYFKATDGDKKVYQSFMANDKVVCAQFNIAESDYTLEDVSNKFYWRTVRSVSSAPVLVNSGQDDEALCHYIDVLVRSGLGSGVPAAGDEIALLGNSSNTARQNAIVISAYDIDWLDTGYGQEGDLDYVPKLKAPFIVQYAGINNFTLYNKRVNVMSFGLNQFKGKFIASGGDDLESMFNDVQKGIKPWTHQVWADSITEVKSGNTRTGWTISGFSNIYKSSSRWFCLYTDYTEGESHIVKSLFTGADVTWMPFNTTIDGVAYKYLLTQSDTQPSDNDFNTNGWDTTAGHPMTKGWYLWTRETITYGNGTVISTYTPARIGDDGETGQEGVSSYLHIAYSTSADGSENFSTTSFDGAIYIGIRRDEDPDDPSGATAYTKYSWSRFLGNDGQDGADGLDGVDGLDGLSAPPSYVENKVSHYLAWNASTGVTKSTGTWSTSYPDTTGANRFLWQYDSFTYTVNEGVKNLLLDSKNQFNYYQQNNNYIAKIKLSQNLVNGNTYSLVFRAEDLSEFGITHCNFDVYLTTAWTAPGKSSSSRHISQATRIMQQADGTCRVTFTAVTPDDTNKQLAIYVQGIGMSEDVPEVYWAMLTEGAVMYQWAAAHEDLAYETDVALVGSSGRSISRIEEQYVQGTSNTTAPSSGWTTNLLNPTSAKQYVWNREVTYFTDATSSTSTPHILLTYWANKTNEVVKYAVGTATQPSDSAFTYTSVPTVNKGEYLWTMTETTYGDNSKSRSYSVSYKGTDGTNGTSPYFADIDNEMDSIACTSAGKPSSAQTVSTTVSFYFGSTRQNCKITGVKRNGTAMTTGTAVSGITPTFPSAAGSTRTLSLAYSTSATVSKDTYEITVTGSNGNNSRTLYFVVNGIKAGANGTNGTNGADGEDAVLYRLVPSVSSVILKKDLTYSVNNVSCTRQKSVGGTITNNTTEGTITYKIDGGSETSYTNNTNIAVSGITKNIQFIYKISGTTVDIETIPLVADGVDGTNPIYADIDNEMDSIACTTAGVPSSAQTVSTKVSMWNGSTKISSPTIKVYDNTTSGAAYTSGTAKNGITATWSASTGSISFAFATSVAAFTKKVFCITVSKSINGTTETRELYFTVNGIRPGANGTNGTNGANGADGANAVIYNIVPEKDSINVARDGSAYVPANVSITCGYVKNDGGTATKVNDVSSRIDSKYNLYFRRRTRSNQAWETKYYLYNNGSTSYKSYLTSLAVATYDAVEFVLSTATAAQPATGSIGTVIDRETVPIVSDGEEGNGIKKVTVTYAGSTSGTTAPSSGWQSTVPSVALGNYLWTRSVTEYTDTSVSNTTSYSVSRIGADGANGTPGQPGADGRTPYFHTAYANSADGSVNFSPTYFVGASYIGTCTDYTETDPSTYSSYEWAELRGMDNAGVYVSAVKNYYKVTNSNTTPDIDSSWTLCPPGTIPQPTDSNRFLWNYEVTEYGCQYPNMVLGSDNPRIGGDPYIFRFDNTTNGFVHGEVYSFAMKLGQLPSPKTYYMLQIQGPSYIDGVQKASSRAVSQNVGQNPAYPTRLVPNEDGIITGTFECNLHSSDTYGDVDHVQRIWVSAFPEGGTYDVPSFDWITIVKGTQVASWSKALSELTQTIPPHLIATKGEKGDSAWVADLTNEMDSVSCDDTGYVVSQQAVSTTLSLFYGQTAKNFGTPTVKRNGSTITVGTTYDWGKVTYSSKVVTVTYYTAATITGKDNFAITITASDDNTVVRTLTFTVNGVKGDVYNLLPKDQNINATRDEAGQYLVNGSSTFPLTCGYTKNVNGVVTTVENLEDWDIEGKYRIFIRIRRRSDGKWQLWDGSKTPSTNYETGVPLYNRFKGADLVKSGTTYTRSTVNINTYDAIEFILTDQGEDRIGGWATANTNAIDSETIYVVADGVKGDGADFVSTVFKRSNTKPSTPTGGTYASPVPSGWEDGIPEGTAIVWSSHRKFTQSGTGQDATWSTPAQVTDTATYDAEFAVVQTNDVTPATPTDNNRHKDASPYGYSGQIWFDPEKDKYSAANTLRDFTAMAWRAERECKNGVWSDWVIVRIKGEQGAGIKQATLTRNSWTKSTWDSYCTKTTATAWTDDNGDIATNCRIGDIFIVQGEATDTHDYYTVYQRLASITSTGKCNGYTVSYTIGKKGDDGAGVSISSSETKYVKKETKPTEAQFNSSTYTNDNFPPFAIGETWWSRTTVTYSDGTTTKAYGVNKIGQDGSSGTPGAPGTDGRTTYFHIAYANTSNNSDSSFSTTYFAGAKFIGTCTDFNKADPTTFSSYEWKEFKGEDGLGLTAPPEMVETATSHTLASSASSGVTTSTAGWDTVTVSTPTLKYIWKYVSYSYEAAVPNLLRNSLDQFGIAMSNAAYIAKVPLWEPLIAGETYTLTFHCDNLKETDPDTGARLYSITSLTVRTRHSAYVTSSTNLLTQQSGYQVHDGNIYSLTFKCKAATNYPNPSDPNPSNAIYLQSVGFNPYTAGVCPNISWLMLTKGESGYSWQEAPQGAAHNDSPWITGVYGDQGGSITNAVLLREGSSYTDSWWQTKISDTSEITWSNAAIVNEKCRVGDMFAVQGESYQTGNKYTLYYMYTGGSGTSAKGTYVSHQVSYKGNGIVSQTEYYLISESDSGVYTDTAGWTTSMPTPTLEKPYLWNYEVTTYTEGNPKTTNPHVIYNLAQGAAGSNYVSGVTNYYLAHSSKTGVTRSTSGWVTDPTASAAQTSATKRYLWNYEVVEWTAPEEGRNLLTTKVANGRWKLSSLLADDNRATVTASVKLTVPEGKTHIKFALYGKNANDQSTYSTMANVAAPAGEHTLSATFVYNVNNYTSITEFRVYCTTGANNNMALATGVDWVKLEFGSAATAYSLSPEAMKSMTDPHIISVHSIDSYKSTCFIRTNNVLSTKPTGGSYASPKPTSTITDNGVVKSWEDGIPSGEAILWATTRKFTSSGTDQDAEWSMPRQMTDTDTYDVEFALKYVVNGSEDTPPAPTANNRHKDDSPYGYSGQIWFDPVKDKYSASGVLRDFTKMYWRAELEISNGAAVGDWTILRIKGETGDTGQSSYKSTMFVRMNSTPTKPANSKGSYSTPSPSNCLAGTNSSGTSVYWSDGIPSGTNKLWATTRIFSSDGEAPQQSSWSTPRQMTDTTTYDVEFAKKQANDATPSDPTTSPNIWYDPDTDTSQDFTKMYWRAERECVNGVWSEWTILRIKGEQGDNGDDAETYALHPVENGETCRMYYNTNTSKYVIMVALDYKVMHIVGATPTEMTSGVTVRWKFNNRADSTYTNLTYKSSKWTNYGTSAYPTTNYSPTGDLSSATTVIVQLVINNEVKDTRSVPLTFAAQAVSDIDDNGRYIRNIVTGTGYEGGSLVNHLATVEHTMEEITSQVSTISSEYVSQSTFTQAAASINSKVYGGLLNGANLLLDSKNQTSGFDSSLSTAAVQWQTKKYFACFNFGSTKPGPGDSIIISWQQTNVSGAVYRVGLYGILPTGSYGTLKASGDLTTTASGYYAYKVTLDNSYTCYKAYIYTKQDANDVSSITQVAWAKAEFCDQNATSEDATEWTPAIVETGSEISQTANNILLSVEDVGINVNDKQITLNGNTQVNGTLKLDGSGDGFQLLSNTGTALITPESIGTYTDFQQTNKVTINPNFTGVRREYIRENGYYRMGMSTQTKELGTFDAGSQIEVTYCSAQIYLYQNGYPRLTGTISGTISFYENNVLKETKTFPYTGTYTTQTTGDVKVLIDQASTFFTVRQSGTGVPQAEADSYDLMDAAYYASNPNALWMIYMTFRVPVPGAYVRVASDGVGVKTSNGNTAYFGPSGMHISPLLQNVTNVTTTNYSASVNDDVIIVSSSSSSAVSITLPTGGGIPEGKVIYVKNVGQASACNVYAIYTSGSGSSPRMFAHDSNTASSSVNIGRKMSFFISFDTGSGIGWLQGYCST